MNVFTHPWLCLISANGCLESTMWADYQSASDWREARLAQSDCWADWGLVISLLQSSSYFDYQSRFEPDVQGRPPLRTFTGPQAPIGPTNPGL